jgi:Copper type II ascorbate-dependent monooxygenase, C-terminal domain
MRAARMAPLFGVLVAIATCVACGSTVPGGSAAPGADGGAASSSSGSGSSGSSSSGGGDSATADGETVTLTMGPFTVPPGTEVFKCQNFANPFGDVDQDIKEYETHMSPGSHHMFLFFSDANADGPIQDCPAGGLEFHPYPFSTQTRDASLTYPDTVGSLIPAKTGFELNGHYINTGATPIQGTVTAILHKAKPGTVQQHAGVIFMNDASLTVPPGSSTSTASCNLPGNINIMTAASHMHQRATGFTAKATDGTVLYQTDQWAEPVPRVFAPVLALSQPTNVTWGCSYNNETSQTLTFGEFAETNVMCIFTMHYYPVADPHNPTLACQR